MVPQSGRELDLIKQQQDQRAYYFSIVVIVNLVGVACLLLAWKTHSINDVRFLGN